MFIRNADDEEPNCNRCEHVCESDDLCSRFCGAENGWNRYEREVEVEDGTDSQELKDMF